MGHFAVLDHNETGVAAGRPVQHQKIAEAAQSVSPQLVDHDVALPIKPDHYTKAGDVASGARRLPGHLRDET